MKLKTKDIFINGQSNAINKPKSIDEVNSFSIAFLSQEDAEAFSALFPKYTKMKIRKISYFQDGQYPFIQSDIYLGTDKRTGDVNEAALKRRVKVFQILKENNIDILNN